MITISLHIAQNKIHSETIFTLLILNKMLTKAVGCLNDSYGPGIIY